MAKFIAMNWDGDNKEGYTGIGIEHTQDPHRKYIGEYVDGLEQGIGVYHSRNSDHIYAGQFNNNKSEGIGFKSYFNGEEFYCGEYKNNKRNGIGYWQLNTGATYVGEHRNGDINGFGTLTTPDGFKFIGKVRNWFPDPESGRWYNHHNEEIDITKKGYHINGTKYTGDDKEGICVWPNGEVYKGQWRGRGDSSGTTEGMSLQTQRHGVGTMFTSNGGQYDGEWQRGEQNGFGTYTSREEETTYVGYYKDGLKHGIGTSTNPNGPNEYVGKWIRDKKEGYGTMTLKDGTLLQGEWSNDKFIKARKNV